MSAYAIDPTATDGGFHLCDCAEGVTLLDEPRLFEVNFVRRKDSPTLTGQYPVGMLPQPGLLLVQEHFVASRRQVLPLAGVADLEPGDLIGVAHDPLFRVAQNASQHADQDCRTPGLSCHKFACHR